MPTLTAAVKAILAAPKVVKAVKQLNASPLDEHFAAAVAEVNQDMIQISYAFCRAFAALALGYEPSAEQVDEFMRQAAKDPAFPWRAHRLLGEMKKSASERRRRFLAAMLFGLSFETLPDDDRDRVDMVVDQLLPVDAALLLKIADLCERKPAAPGVRHYVNEFVAFISQDELRLVTSDYWIGSEFRPEATTDPALKEDRSALTALLSLDCVSLDEVVLGGTLSHEGYAVQSVTPTSLGYLVVRAINEVLPGLGGKL